MFDSFSEAILEEAVGTICGLPPGTVAAAKATGLALSSTAASSTQKSTVNKNTSGMSKKEKKAIEVAVHNLASTAKLDNPTWSDKKCAVFAMNILALADKIYSGDDFRQAFLDALSKRRSQHRNLIRNVARAVR